MARRDGPLTALSVKQWGMAPCDQTNSRWVPPLNPAACLYIYQGTWQQSGINKHPNGDAHFLCMNGRFYSCGWGDASWETSIGYAGVVGTWSCNGSDWVAHGPLYSPERDQGDGRAVARLLVWLLFHICAGSWRHRCFRRRKQLPEFRQLQPESRVPDCSDGLCRRLHRSRLRVSVELPHALLRHNLLSPDRAHRTGTSLTMRRMQTKTTNGTSPRAFSKAHRIT